jgi:hypothetical protein
MSPDAIGQTLCDALDHFMTRPEEQRTAAAWEALVERLHAQLVAPDPTRGAAGLLWVLRTGQRYGYQNLAGELLARYMPPSPAPLGELLEVVRAMFDASAYRTAEWIDRTFGRDAVLAGVRALGALEGLERRRVNSFLYCIGIDPDPALGPAS